MGILISTEDCSSEIKTRLLQKEKLLKSEGIDFFVTENQEDSFSLFEIDFDKKSYKHYFYRLLAGIIAEVVVDKLEEKIIKKILRSKYKKFTKTELDKIEKRSLQYLNVITGKNNIFFSKFIRKEELVKNLMSYLEKYDDINVEGFVRFRLKDYTYKLQLAIERAVDEYMMEKEYYDFIELLKYFVDLQEPRVERVDIIRNRDGSYVILDSDGKEIGNEYMENYLKEISDGKIEYEDLLISALINIVPANIYLHFAEKDIIETLRNIFGNKIKIGQKYEN